MALITPLVSLEEAGSEFTQKIVLTGADIALLTSGTGASIYPVFNGSTTFPAGMYAFAAAWRVQTAFAFTPGTLVFSVGDAGDAARFVAASTDLKTAAYGAGAITKYPYMYNAAGAITITVTAGSGALTSVTAGELHLYLGLTNVAKLDQ
jgi:hypothetical protein